MKRTSGARPNTKVVIKGGSVKKNSQADQLKQQGNAFFISLEYEKAIDCYTRCLPQVPESDHTLRCVVYSNRAQCRIKLKEYEQAYQDADAALKSDQNHLKSIQRRGTAAYYTQRMRQARKDFMHSLALEYSAQFEEYLKKASAAIEKVKAEAYEKLKRKVRFNSGVDFDAVEGDVDESKRIGVDAFKRSAERIEVTEMNLDEKQLQEMKARKEQIL